MSLQVQCPHCKMVCLVAREHAAKPVRCPGCRQTFAVKPTRLPEAPPAPTLPPPARLEIGAATSVGKVRERNEDSFLTQQMTWCNLDRRRELALLAVADGMGGHAGGDRASGIAIGAIATALSGQLARFVGGDDEDLTSTDLLDQLDQALFEASRAVQRAAMENEELDGMGATAALVLVRGDLALVCHVGDCRVYHGRGGKWQPLTEDQTLARRMVQLGTLSDAEADRHPAASQVTQALGRQLDLEPGRRDLTLAAGDWLLLCCDGLHGQVSEEVLNEELSKATAPRDLAQRLTERAGEAGGSDNCTVLVVRCV